MNDNPGLEHEADSLGAKAAQMKSADNASAAIQKKSEGDGPAQMKVGDAPIQRALADDEIVRIATAVHTAVDGVGTDEAAIYAALAKLKNDKTDIDAVKAKYVALFGATLEADLKGDLSGAELTKALGYLMSTVERLNSTVAAVDGDMNKMWTDSFNADKSEVKENGSAIAENGGKVSAKNIKKSDSGGSINLDHTMGKGDTLIGDIHTHPYSTSEGGHEGVAFSAADISSMRGLATQGFQRMVEAGTTRFAMVITDEAKAKKFYADNDDAKIDKTWNDTFAGGAGTFHAKVIAAIWAVIGKDGVNGISFYHTVDAKKLSFAAM